MVNVEQKVNEGWIHCNIIIEMLGKPKDYVEKVIKEISETIGKTKGIEVIKSTPHEPKVIKEGFFSTFTELELLIENLNLLIVLIFSYMPSNIEILAPSEMKIRLSDANEFVNLLTSKLHGYDGIAKKLKFENMLLKKRLEEVGAIPKQGKQEEELDTIKTEEKKE